MSLVPRASAADTAGALADVLMPLTARGVIVRRPPVMGLLDRMDADRRLVRRMQRLRERYGPGPLLLRIPGRELALVLSPEHVRRILDESPKPFALATREKRGALSHFQPHGVLISHGPEREDRRRFNEEVLDYHQDVHRLHDSLATKVADEVDGMLTAARASGGLSWDEWAVAWWRMVRRVVLGDAAREDHALTDMLRELRGDANWSYLKPKRDRLRKRFFLQLNGHLERAEPGSLAALVAFVPSSAETRPADQVPQWLFAFDAAGMATYRALALLSADPGAAGRTTDQAFLRAAVLESVRLWPTTPAILRDTTEDTEWESGTLPAGASLAILAPFFHRDDSRLDIADSFAPETWLNGSPARDWPLVPFSAGPGECAGKNLVLFTASTWLARTCAAGVPALSDRSTLTEPLPRTLSPFRLRFAA